MNSRESTTLLHVILNADSYDANKRLRSVCAGILNRKTGISIGLGVSIELDAEGRNKSVEIAATAYDDSKEGRKQLTDSFVEVMDFLEENKYIKTPPPVYMRHLPYEEDDGTVRGLVRTDTRIQKVHSPELKITLKALDRWLTGLGVLDTGDHQKQRDFIIKTLADKDKEPIMPTVAAQPQYAQWGAWQ